MDLNNNKIQKKIFNFLGGQNRVYAVSINFKKKEGLKYGIYTIFNIFRIFLANLKF